MKNKKIQKRRMILLEVLIAMTIVALCILPLVTPYAWMLFSEKKHTRELLLDRSINLFYVDILEKLYRNDIAWSDIQNKKRFVVDNGMWNRIGFDYPLSYQIQYWFELAKHQDEILEKNDGNKKEKKDPEWILGLYRLTFDILPLNADAKTKPLFQFSYELPILRHPEGPVPFDAAPANNSNGQVK